MVRDMDRDRHIDSEMDRDIDMNRDRHVDRDIVRDMDRDRHIDREVDRDIDMNRDSGFACSLFHIAWRTGYSARELHSMVNTGGTQTLYCNDHMNNEKIYDQFISYDLNNRLMFYQQFTLVNTGGVQTGTSSMYTGRNLYTRIIRS